MHGREKSDFAIVAGKPTNKAVPTAAEPVERRAGAKGNASQQSTHRTQRRVRVSQALERVRQDSPSHTQGGSRVREFRSHGSGRGAVSNGRPYRTSMRVLRILTLQKMQKFVFRSALRPNQISFSHDQDPSATSTGSKSRSAAVPCVLFSFGS